MFAGKFFYHSHIRKAIIAFGTIFNNIVVQRKNSEGEYAQSLRVPLAYSTKQKFLARIASVPTIDPANIAITLPRIGFEITGLNYNPTRKINILTKNIAVGAGDDTNKLRSQFTSTPYDMSISLYIFAKNQDDGLQIIEQILPFFNPDFCVTINDVPEMGIKRDLQITMEGIDYEDQYEGDYAQRQSVIWTLNFKLGLNFYGPVELQGIIRTAIANTYANDIADINNGQRYTVTTTPSDVTPEIGTWDYVETFDEFFE
jgi:hypothetical protein